MLKLLKLFIYVVMLSIILSLQQDVFALGPDLIIPENQWGICRSIEEKDFQGWQLPERDELSFSEEFILSRFPKDFHQDCKNGKVNIEIHRGHLSSTMKFLNYLKQKGAKVEELKDIRGMHRIFRVTYEEQKSKTVPLYIISKIIGSSRELEILQGLMFLGYIHTQNISIREFNFNIQALFQNSMGKFAGRIDKAVITHNIEMVIGLIKDTIDSEISIVEEIKSDYVDATVIKTAENQQILLFNLQYTNGEQFKEVIKYFCKQKNSGGLGVKNIYIKNAAGAVSDDISIHDIVLIRGVYSWDGNNFPEKLVPIGNDVDANLMKLFMPHEVTLHDSISSFSFPTILTETVSSMQEVNQKGGGAIELEMRVLGDLQREFSKVKFFNFYEITDKPVFAKSEEDMTNTLGSECPADTEVDKRRLIFEAAFKYILWHDSDFMIDIEKTAEILSIQNSNVIFEKNSILDKWIFRHSSIKLAIPKRIVHALGQIMQMSNREGFLLNLRGESKDRIVNILKNIIVNKVDVKTAFEKNGIKCFYEYKKVLLVAPYGDQEGRPLQYVIPHKGVEQLAFRINRECQDVDCRVYNPNLTSLEELYSFAEREKPDIIAVSCLQTVMKRTVEILGGLWLVSPNSKFILGGSEMNSFPRKELFESLHVDEIILDDGSSLINMLNADKSQNVKSAVEYKNPFSDIPQQKDVVEVTHGKAYSAIQENQDLPVSYDRIGRTSYRISIGHLGNRCKGHCIFCGIPLNSINAKSPEEIFAAIKKEFNPKLHDSIHFECPDFLFDIEWARELCKLMAEDGEICQVPKMVISRVDEIGDGSILLDMRKAGIRKIAYGVESFNAKVLKKIGKQTTPRQNIKAVEKALDAGIIAGLNAILFKNSDTVETIQHDISKMIYFIKKGAFVNVVPYLFAGWGRPVSKMTDLLEYEIYDFPGMKKPLHFPKHVKYGEPGLVQIREKTMEILGQLWDNAKQYPGYAKASPTIYSLMLFKAFYLALQEKDLEQAFPPQRQSFYHCGIEFSQQLYEIEQCILYVLDRESDTTPQKYYPELGPRAVENTSLFNGYFEKQLSETHLILDNGEVVDLIARTDAVFAMYNKDKYLGEIYLMLDKENKIALWYLEIPDVCDRSGFLMKAVQDWIIYIREYSDILYIDENKGWERFEGELPHNKIFNLGKVVSPTRVDKIEQDMQILFPQAVTECIQRHNVPVEIICAPQEQALLYLEGKYHYTGHPIYNIGNGNSAERFYFVGKRESADVHRVIIVTDTNKPQAQALARVIQKQNPLLPDILLVDLNMPNPADIPDKFRRAA